MNVHQIVEAVLFASDAGGVGLNLQRAASCCVNLDLPWNPAVLEQRVGRIYRLGQKLPIVVYNLVSQDCIESRIASIVSDKRQLFEGLFDGTTDEVEFDRSGSFLSGIERIVDVVEPPPSGADDGDDLEGAAEREVEEVLSAADESRDEADEAAAVGNGDPAPLVDVSGLLAQVEVRRTPDGGMRIDAPPETAETLAVLFEGVAGLLRGPKADRRDPR